MCPISFLLLGFGPHLTWRGLPTYLLVYLHVFFLKPLSPLGRWDNYIICWLFCHFWYHFLHLPNEGALSVHPLFFSMCFSFFLWLLCVPPFFPTFGQYLFARAGRRCSILLLGETFRYLPFLLARSCPQWSSTPLLSYVWGTISLTLTLFLVLLPLFPNYLHPQRRNQRSYQCYLGTLGALLQFSLFYLMFSFLLAYCQTRTPHSDLSSAALGHSFSSSTTYSTSRLIVHFSPVDSYWVHFRQ